MVKPRQRKHKEDGPKCLVYVEVDDQWDTGTEA